jgi:hypothetical protein
MHILVFCKPAGHLTQLRIHGNAFGSLQTALVGLEDSQACQSRSMLVMGVPKPDTWCTLFL